MTNIELRQFGVCTVKNLIIRNKNEQLIKRPLWNIDSKCWSSLPNRLARFLRTNFLEPWESELFGACCYCPNTKTSAIVHLATCNRRVSADNVVPTWDNKSLLRCLQIFIDSWSIEICAARVFFPFLSDQSHIPKPNSSAPQP